MIQIIFKRSKINVNVREIHFDVIKIIKLLKDIDISKIMSKIKNTVVVSTLSGSEQPDECEPGASHESMLITTDSIEEFSQEMSSSLEETGLIKNSQVSNISEIQEELKEDESDTKVIVPEITKSDSFCSSKSSDLLSASTSDLLQQQDASDDYLHDDNWLHMDQHVFILSSAGKPIYALHGNEDKLATLFGVMQALVSVVQAQQDTIKSIHAMGIKFVFLVKSPLILVAISRHQISVQQIQIQLT